MVSQQAHDEIEEVLGHVPSFIEEMPPQVADPFWHTMRDMELSETTKIPPKYKELIGLAAAAAMKCPYCTHFHTEAAKLHGANAAEIAEASAMAMMTAGASTFLHGQQTDIDRFKKETAQITDHIERNH